MTTIDHWLRHNTFHHSHFWELLPLLKEKERRGLTVSVCIPTLNEEKTIGKEVMLLRSELMERYPLIDELAVIDSGSTDQTLEVAAAFGADVYRGATILPHYGHKRGKGENLWKAIYQLQGDILCYIDADIKNIHPRFVYALVAPLIYRDTVQYVKAFYDRPLAYADGLVASGGGRVTEILVRPLFSLFFPELTALIQPLSGEYAVRREVLEAISFPIGYGVETSHLIDVYQQWGLEAFAQVDLDRRVHRNQTTIDLGKMAFGILQSFLARMEPLGMADFPRQRSAILRQFCAQGEDYQQTTYNIVEDERPPMRSVAEYQHRRATRAIC